MTKTIILALLVVAACKHDDRKAIKGGECEAFTASYSKFEACTKIDATARAAGDRSRQSVEVIMNLAAKPENKDNADLPHVRANTCKDEQKKIDELLAAAGC